MKVIAKQDKSTLYIALYGELDECTSDYVRRSIDGAIATNKFENLVFDMMGVKFMDSTGIGVLLGRYKLLKRMNIPVYIANCSAHVDRILNMSGIFNIMKKII